MHGEKNARNIKQALMMLQEQVSILTKTKIAILAVNLLQIHKIQNLKELK